MSFDIPSDSEEDDPDWLEGLQSGGDDADADFSGSSPPGEEEGAPDWLPDSSSEDSRSTSQSEEGEVPDWLAGIREAEESLQQSIVDPSSKLPAEGDSPDWLKSIRDQQVEETGSMDQAGDVPSGDFIGRIQQLQAQESSGGGADETQEWASGVGGEESPIAGETPSWAAGEQAEGADGPDWMSGLGSEEPEPQAEAPDWLAMLGSQQSPEEHPTAQISQSPVESGEARDWIGDIGGDETEPQGEALDWPGDIGGEDTVPQGDALDWPGELGDQPPGEDTSAEMAKSRVEGDGAPDWLSEMVGEEPAISPAFPAFTAGDQEGAAAVVGPDLPDLPGEPDEVKMPSWLDSLQESSPDVEVPDGTSVFDVPVPAAFTDEGESFLLEPTDLPDWLSEDVPLEVIEEPPARVETGDIDIAPAELPSWLQAMRPVEAVSLPVEAAVEARPPGLEESIGPLAGLSNVLPAEPDIVHFGTPSVPITGINITETQQNYARLLESLVIGEEEVHPPRKRVVALPQQILRWAIAGILYAAVFFPILLGGQSVPLPSTDNVIAEIQDVAVMIDGLPENAPVLIAFEYQPGLSGEMEAAAAAVVDHLLNQGAHPVVISTHPTGPGLAENFLQSTQSHHLFISDRHYVNLGYISGGTAALLHFAADPRAAVPLPLEEGGSGWDKSPLTGINEIRDFTMVLVISDDPDAARGWIEQVGPFLVDPSNPQSRTPLIMVVSAQAGPLIYPYYLSSPKQVDGLVSGLSGGAYYENTTNRPGLARLYWNGFSAGLIVSIIIIIFGGLFNLARLFLTSRRASRQ